MYSIVARISSKVIRWVFAYQHDRDFQRRYILPWALPEAEVLPEDHRHHDFVVCVSFDRDNIHQVAELAGLKFILAGECYMRYPKMKDAVMFVQDFRWHDLLCNVHYAPQMMMWCPPVSCPKTKRCSVVDSGKYPWRNDLIRNLNWEIGVDIYGKLSGLVISGYHGCDEIELGGNEKYLGIQEYAFYLSLENQVARDYLTEKVNDAIMCEAVPIYRGAPNMHLYYLPGSYIPLEKARQINWTDWKREYEQRRDVVLKQKELLRTRFNVFSYFHLLTDDFALLNHRRPITL
jgi:hypothetical protein